jgi:DNA topoisomerase-1
VRDPIDFSQIVERRLLFNPETNTLLLGAESPDQYEEGSHGEVAQALGIGAHAWRGHGPSEYDRFTIRGRIAQIDGEPWLLVSETPTGNSTDPESSDALHALYDKLAEYGAPSEMAVSVPGKTSESLRKRRRALGGPGSGNFGHSGRPGQVGGSAPAGAPLATSGEPGATTGFRPATPEQRKALGLPPAWTDVVINPDPKGRLLATGRDVKGRRQYRYSAKHGEITSAEKFGRMTEFDDALPSLRRQIERDLRSSDEETRNTAAVLSLIDKTGFRIGSDKDNLADKKAYGATTLLREHVRVEGDTTHFSFVGKKGVDVKKSVKDADLARTMRRQLEGKQRGDRIFDVRDRHVRQYFDEHAPDFTPKDFRTRHATALALSLIKAQPIPKTKKEFKAARRAVGTKVADFLGNTHTVALKSYIDPTVFAKWEARQ